MWTVYWTKNSEREFYATKKRYNAMYKKKKREEKRTEKR